MVCAPAEALAQLLWKGGSTKWSSFLARLRLFLASSDGGSLRVSYDINPLRVRRGLSTVVVMPVPPFVRLCLGVAFWRVLPTLLAAEGGDIEIAPDCSHRLIAAAVNEIGAEHPFAVTEEYVMAVPFIDTEVLVEAVGHGVPGHLPAHALLQARDVRLRGA